MNTGTATGPGGRKRLARQGAWRALVLAQTFILLFSLMAPAIVSAEEPSAPPPTEQPATEPAPAEEPAPVVDPAPAEEPAPAPEPTLATDKYDYLPGETVYFTGTNWDGDASVSITVVDLSNLTEVHRGTTQVKGDGTIAYSVDLPTYFVRMYKAIGVGSDTGRSAEVVFSDLAIGTYDQCSNDLGTGYIVGDLGCRWIYGNLQSNNSRYSEGDATVQRLWLTDLLPGSVHSVTLKYGTTKGGNHSYDYLTKFDWSENWVTLADRCQGIPGCEAAIVATGTFPDDPNLTNLIEPATGRGFTMHGVTAVTNVSTPTIVSGAYTGDSETVITIDFRVDPGSGSMCTTKNNVTTCGVALWFGAHVAVTQQWIDYNNTTGAGSIEGSPYHVALDKVDGDSVGQRDNQMQAGAVPLNGKVVIIKDAVPNDSQDFDFNVKGGNIDSSFQLDDDSNPTLSNTKTLSLPAGTYTAAELGSYLGWTFTGLVCTVTGTDGSTVSVSGQTATIGLKTAFDTTPDTITCTYTNTKAKALTATKTASGTYDRTVTWTLTKSVDDDSHSGYAGDSFNSTWTVVADKSESFGNYQVSGSIVVTNPNAYAVPVTVTDQLSDGTAGAVQCPSASVPANGTLTCTYTASPSTKASSNTATIASGDPNVSGTTAAAAVAWTEKLIGYDSGILADSRFSFSDTISGDTTKTFPETFSCSTKPADYTDGKYSYTETNTATLDSGIGLSASASVTVDCTLQAPTALKDATATYKQDITWTLDKTVSDDSHSAEAGQVAGTSTWEVTATKTIGAPYGWLVTGSITVKNPAAIAQTFTISDVLDDGTVAAVTCPTQTVAAGGQVVCTYTASPADGSATLNTATITFPGNPAVIATAPVSYGSIHVGSETAVLEDGLVGYKETIDKTTVLEWDQTFSCSSDQSSYTDGKYSYTETNTATLKFGTETLTKQATVGVDCTLKALVPSKTAQGEWDRTVTWTLDKSVDDDSHTGFAGDTFSSIWKVDLAKIVDGPKNWKITGTIDVYNPATIAQTFTVADTLDDGTLVTVSCPALTVAPLATVTCTYEAFPDDATATLNTAVVSATGNADQPATAAVPWKENLTGSDSGNLTDPRFTYDENVSSSTTETLPEPFACSTNPADYTDGTYSETFTNDAYFKNVDHKLTDSASVTVDCYQPAKAKVVKYTTDGPEDIGQFPFTFKLYNPSGTLVETKTLSDAGNVTFDAEIKTEGTWKIVEVLPAGWVSQDASLTCSFAVDFWADAGKTFTCTFNNKEKGRVSVYKLTKGPGDPAPWIDTSKNWQFAIYNGPDGFGSTALATDSTLNDATGLLDFGNLDLDPGKTYTICELTVPSGWTAEWMIDTDGDGIADQVVIPYNPNADETVPQDLGNRCFDFGAETSYAVPAGDTLAFQVINEFPGGAPRTPGYWKNWNRCTGGGQADNADRQGGRAEGYTLLEDILTSPGITWDDILPDTKLVPITQCDQAVEILDQRVVQLDANNVVGNGKKLASDGARTLAMHLLAAQLNEGNGACINQNVKDVILWSEKLLDKHDFDGTKTTAYLTTKSADYAYALQLAKYLDAYNNSDCDFTTLPTKPTNKYP